MSRRHLINERRHRPDIGTVFGLEIELEEAYFCRIGRHLVIVAFVGNPGPALQFNSRHHTKAFNVDVCRTKLREAILRQ